MGAWGAVQALYARVLDIQHKFLEASLRFYDLAQNPVGGRVGGAVWVPARALPRAAVVGGRK
jgi:hypothetical protein